VIKDLINSGDANGARKALADLRGDGGDATDRESLQWLELEIDSLDQPPAAVLAKAAKLSFDDPDLRTRVGLIRARALASGDVYRPKEAIKLLRTVLAGSTPDLTATVATQLGWLLWIYRPPGEAVEFLLSHRLSNMPEPRAYLAYFLAVTRRVEAARAVFKPIRAEFSREDPAFAAFLECFISFKESPSPDSANALAASAEAMRAYCAPGLVEAAEALFSVKERARAVSLLEAAERIDPGYDRCQYDLAALALSSFRFRETLRHIRTARHWNYRRLLFT
jgi:tetratricopeptide (TPR) repeat protein